MRIRARLSLTFLISFIFACAFCQEFDAETASKKLESYIATDQFLPAARLAYRLGDYYLSQKKYQESIKSFEDAAFNATKSHDAALHANAINKKGMAQKMYAESGRLAMASEQQLYQECIATFKQADELYTAAKRKGSREHLLALFYGGEALFIVGNYEESIGPLRTVVRYAQKNRYEEMVIKASDLLVKNYDQLDDALNYEYYLSINESYRNLKFSRDSLKRAHVQLQMSKDSLAKSRESLQQSIDSLQRTQQSLQMTSESLSKSKDSLKRSKESLIEYEASLNKAEDSLMRSKESLEQSYAEIAVLDSANLQQRTDLEIQQAEIIRKQAEIIRQQEEISQKEEEVKNERTRYEALSNILSENQELLNIMIIATVIVGFLLFFAVLAYQYKRRTTKKLKENNRQINHQKSLLEKRQKELQTEKSKTEALLLNILPVPVANELRANKRVTPRYYKMVSILFTDFKGFTTIAEKMSPGEIVRQLDACFIAFDQIIENYERKVGRKCIEKIKTIGDGYMCAGGVPIENESNPMDVVRVGLAMIEYMEKLKADKIAKGEPFFEIRIGINTGPVVAGVVGKKKFAYDIWGDSVNLASRMESSGEVGRLNISEDTYRYVKDKFFFTPRGKITAKNKGEVEMYFVDGRIRYNTSNMNHDPSYQNRR